MTKKSTFVFWMLNIALPLLFGITIYLFYRPDTFISDLIFRLLGIRGFSVSNPQTQFGASLVSFVRYFLCDILWAYALTFTCALILGPERPQRLIGLGVSLGLEMMIELFQKFQILRGTFDFLDVLLEFVATLVAVLIIKIFYCRFKGGM